MNAKPTVVQHADAGAIVELHVDSEMGDDVRTVYEQLYAQHDVTQHFASFYHWILKLLAVKPGQRLLDISCGTAHLAAAAQALGVDAQGVDFSAVALRQAQPSLPLYVGNAELLPMRSQCFDYAVNIGSLEHFADMAAGVREHARVLKPDGKACILVPNTFGLLWTIWHARHTGEIFDDGQPLQRYATLGQWRRLLEGNGLIIERVVPFEGPLPHTLDEWRLYLRKPKVNLIKLAVGPFVPLPLASMFIFLCRPA